MFDVATRPQPARNAAAVAGVPFDWRLTPPAPASTYPWTNYATSTGTPEVFADVLQTYALAMEDSLATAVIISLFTDRRAGRDDALPLGQSDRRGWVGDEFMGEGFDTRPSRWGNLLWLVYVSKTLPQILEFARFTVREGLQWLVDAGIASSVDVEASWVGELSARLALRITIRQPDQADPVYDVLWGTTISRSMQ